MSPRDPHDVEGRRIAGRYRVDRLAWEGRRVRVYEAWDEARGEAIALKIAVPQPDPDLARAVAERLAAEARVQARLGTRTPGVALALDAGTERGDAGDETAWAAFTWLDGQSLADELWVRRLRGGHGQPLEAVLELLGPVLDALALAHEEGALHLDVGPQAIFLAHGEDGPRAVLTGFGASALPPEIARRGAPETESLARTAPEQIDASLGPLGAFTDVYAIALVVVELLGDTPPFTGEDPADVVEHVLDRARRPTPRALGVAVGDATEDVLAHALAVNPRDRHASAGRFAAALRRAAREDAGRTSLATGAQDGAAGPPSGGALRIIDSLPLARAPYGEVDIRSISAFPPPPRAPADLAPPASSPLPEPPRRRSGALPLAALAIVAVALAAIAWVLLR